MRATTLALAAAGLAVTACTSSGSAGTASTHPPTATASNPTGSATPTPTGSGHRPPYGWPTYHGDNQRTGASASPALRPPLRRAWTRPLDGAVYGQPLVVNGVVIAATENDSVYALRADNGHRLWRRHLGTPVPASALPCGNIDPLGITGTPAYDARTGDVFVVTETTGARHTLHALDARTGKPRWQRNVDVAAGRDPAAEQQRSALLVANGRVYVAFGGLYGDCGNYVGYLAAVPTDGHGATLQYSVPTAREAGMWAAAGPVQDPTLTDIYVATGNGAEVGGSYDGSDSVIRLSPRLHKVGLFAPETWRADNAQDLDLGSSSPIVTAGGTVVIAGKRGAVYLLGPHLGGVGGELDRLDGCAAYGGAASAGRAIVLPCSDGIRMLQVTGHTMTWRWRLGGVAGSPTIAGRMVYSLDADSGDLVMASLTNGKVRARLHVGTVTRFATPAPVGRLVYVGTLTGVVAVHGAA